MLKNVDSALVSAIGRHLDGEAIFGKVEAQGLETGGVGLAINDVTRSYLSEETLELIDDLTSRIVDGSVTVPTAF
ncbi:hypothetical protein D3C71_2163650 [compost metagenome]